MHNAFIASLYYDAILIRVSTTWWQLKDPWLISAAADSGNVFVISTNGSREIFLRASDDYGNSFREITNVQDIQSLPEFDSDLIQLVMAGATVSIVGIRILAKRRFGYG